MTMALNLLYRVIRRRLEKGEDLGTVLAGYPRLTGEEQTLLEQVLKEE